MKRVEPCIQWRELQVAVAGRHLFTLPQLTIEARRCAVLTGANGSGKSSLLRTLAGLNRPADGRVRLNGSDLGWRTARRRLRRRVIYLHQQPYLFDGSVLDNITYGLKLACVPRCERLVRAREELVWAGLEALGGRDAHALSGGERQKVALIRARILRPQVLLLDEPTASLDPASREQTYFLLRRLCTEGVSLIVASHEAERSLRIADSHWHLEAGVLNCRPVREAPTPAPLLRAAR